MMNDIDKYSGTRYIGYVQLIDDDGNDIGVAYPITSVSAIEGFSDAVSEIYNAKKSICTLQVSGAGTNTIAIPFLDGFELLQVISLSGTDYICRGFCLGESSYIAELANVLNSSELANFKCIYIKI